MSTLRFALVPFTVAVVACGTDASNTPLPSGNFAVVTTTEPVGRTGAINLVELANKNVTMALDTTLDADNSVRVIAGTPYVLNKSKSTVRRYDAKSWTAAFEIPAGDSAHPAATAFAQDLYAATNGRIYVSLYGNSADAALGVIDPAAPAGVSKWIALPAASGDADGKPEPGVIYACEDKLYIALVDLDSAVTFAPSGPGRIAIVDTKTDTVEGVIQLGIQNPNGIAQEGADCHDVLVTGSGPFGIAPDAKSGLERVDLVAKTSTVIATGTSLGASPASISVVSKTLAYLNVFFDLQDAPGGGYKILSSAKIIAFNPTTATVIGDASAKAGFITFARAAGNGQLFVGVNVLSTVSNDGKLGAGLYIGPADGMQIPSTPLLLGQDPYSIDFVN